MDDSDMQFVICVSNEGYPGSLETRKVYQHIPDPDAAERNLIRVVDESGEDYLFPRPMFLEVELPEAAKEAILRAS